MISTSTRTDFADWLSPMLVKELRQGIRSKVFMAAFYLTQLLMILSVIFNFSAMGDSGDLRSAGFLNGLFWFMIAVPLLFLMPVRGFGAIYGEIKGGTLELVFLTRLSATRIAVGKWTALMVQTLLLVAAVLPYVLLRYFLGSVNVVDDLQSLFVLLLASGMLTAATIAISPYESKLLRALFSVGMVAGFFLMLGFMMSVIAESFMRSSGGSSSTIWLIYAGLALYVPAFIFLALEIAASRIAPMAENHAIRKRLVGIYLFLACTVLVLLGADPNVASLFALALLAVVVIDALAEPQEFIRSVYQPFLKRGKAGRIAALFLTPGWVSGAWYILLLSVAAGVLMMWNGQLEDPTELRRRLAILGLLLFPAALLRLFMPGTKHFLGLYIALQFFSVALTFLASMMASMSGEQNNFWMIKIPPCVLVLSLFSDASQNETELFFVTAVVTAVSMAILIVRSLPTLGAIRSKLAANPTPHA